MNRTALYRRSPPAVQNLFATAYGLRQLPIRYGGSYRRLVEEMDARQWWHLDRLTEDQDARLRAMVTWCGARVPHYRDLFRELGVEPGDIRTTSDLSALPVLDKEQVRAEPERFRPDDYRGRLIPQTTGGTTGTPLQYWATPAAVQFNYATYETRTRAWAGVEFGDRMASFHGQPIVPAADLSGPFWRRNLAFNQMYFSVYHLADATIASYLDALARFSPQIVVGYTSAVHRIAAAIIERGQQGRINPDAVIVSSETLLPEARAEMTEAFGCRVTNAYSLGELVAYVSECESGGMHVSTEYGVVETVDIAGASEIVATGLFNRAMPLLRYRTGDLASPSSATCCGRGLPLLAELTGRVDDVVQTPEGATVGPAPMSLAFQKVPRLRRAQVHQEDRSGARVLIEVAAGWGAEDLAMLERELRLRLGTSLRLDFEQVDTIPRTSGGKERLVVSTIGRNS